MKFIETIPTPRVPGIFLSLLLLSSCVTTPHRPGAIPALPADIALNKDAGRGNLLFVPVRFESGEEMSFVVDTGSSVTLIDKSLETKLGQRLGTLAMQSWGVTNNLPLYEAPTIYLGGALLTTGKRVAVEDFKRLSSQTGRSIMGMLSIDCLKHYCIQLDFEADKMRFLDASQMDAAKLGKAFPINFHTGGRPFIDHVALVAGKSTNSLIDTGFDADGRVESNAVQAKSSKRVHLQQCVWDGETYRNLVVGHGDNANLLGLRFLARHLVTLDFPNRTMYLKQTSIGPLEADAPEHSPQPSATK